MVQIGKHPLSKEILSEIKEQLIYIQKSVGPFFTTELLTNTEIIMLAKRLATILMLIDEQSYYRIKQVLGVSVSTSKRLHRLLVSSEYERIEKYVAKAKEREALEKRVAKVLRLGLPPNVYIIKKRTDTKNRIRR